MRTTIKLLFMNNVFVRALLISTSVLLAFSANSQVTADESYLIIRFESLYDNTNQKFFNAIRAEGGCEKATAICSLLKYDTKKNADNTKGKLYSLTKVVNDSLYNYFLSPTEGLNFMVALGWKLVFVFSETYSGYDNQQNGSGVSVPITTVGSRPAFCFKK